MLFSLLCCLCFFFCVSLLCFLYLEVTQKCVWVYASVCVYTAAVLSRVLQSSSALCCHCHWLMATPSHPVCPVLTPHYAAVSTGTACVAVFLFLDWHLALSVPKITSPLPFALSILSKTTFLDASVNGSQNIVRNTSSLASSEWRNVRDLSELRTCGLHQDRDTPISSYPCGESRGIEMTQK